MQISVYTLKDMCELKTISFELNIRRFFPTVKYKNKVFSGGPYRYVSVVTIFVSIIYGTREHWKADTAKRYRDVQAVWHKTTAYMKKY